MELARFSKLPWFWDEMITFGNIVILQCLALLRQWAIFSTHSTSWGNSCKCRYSWLHVQPLESLETQKHLVKSFQNSFHQPRYRDVHECLPQTDSASTKKKTTLPTPKRWDAMCNMPCLQQSHQKPWRPFGTGEANIQGIQVLHGGVPHFIPWSLKGVFPKIVVPKMDGL